MKKEHLLAVGNYILVQMENPHDCVHSIAITYYKKLDIKLESKQYYIIRDFLEKEKGLIEKIGNIPNYQGAQYRLTSKGKTVVSLGSIEQFDEENKRKEREKFSETKRKKWFDYIGIGGGVIGIIGGIFGFTSIFTLKESHDFRELKQDIYFIKEKDSLMNVRQLELYNEHVKRIDSLYEEMNKIKNIK